MMFYAFIRTVLPRSLSFSLSLSLSLRAYDNVFNSTIKILFECLFFSEDSIGLNQLIMIFTDKMDIVLFSVLNFTIVEEAVPREIQP